MNDHQDLATEKQLALLRRILPHVPVHELEKMTKQDAHEHISAYTSRWPLLPPTARQKYFLQQWDAWREGLTRGDAHSLIADIKEGLALNQTARNTCDEPPVEYGYVEDY
jgi:hypothetical protein